MRFNLPAFCYFTVAALFCLLFDFAGLYPRKYATEYGRVASQALPVSERSALFRAIAPQAALHRGQSGFHLIMKDSDALRIRLELIEAASRTLDLQYYSMADDGTDQLLIEALLRAAGRGVRIRILIDDITLKKTDKIWAILNMAPHVSLRVFNPFATLDESYFARLTNVVTGVSRFTKRMHNKLFLADNIVGLIGGRNLGDAYFGKSEAVNFRDLDVVAAGPLLQVLSQSFDDFWNGREAYPLSAVASLSVTPQETMQHHNRLIIHWKAEASRPGALPLEALEAQLSSGALPLTWAEAEVAADDPLKVETSTRISSSAPAADIRRLLKDAKKEFIAVSPYFIPGKEGIDLLTRLSAGGIKVRVLTNSLASTDVVAVHAGYAQYRGEVLKAGAELYEMKPLPGRYPPPGRFSRSRRASLHSKLFIIDRKVAIIGSFNIDPRSQRLNTEVVVVIHSPELASRLAERFDQVVQPSDCYQLTPANDGQREPHILWKSEENGETVIYRSDPPSGFWRPIVAAFYSFLPFEQQL